VGVLRAFDVPLGHLALDDSGGGTAPSCGVEPAGESTQRSEPNVDGGAVVVRGKSAPRSDGLARDA